MRARTAGQQRPPKEQRPPPRVRKEPPTIEEAVAAAEGLSSDPNAQVEIAAGLMGVSEDEVRPHIPRRAPRATAIITGRRTVVVERLGRGSRSR